MTATVKYIVATYSGEVIVPNIDADEDNEVIEAKAKQILIRRSGGSLPYGYQSFKVVERREET